MELKQDFAGILVLLGIFNHANNFIIFAFADRRFRDEIRKMFRDCFG